VKTTKKGTVYQCSCCSQEYEDLPLTFGNDYPDYYFSIPANERENRVEKEESLALWTMSIFFIDAGWPFRSRDTNQNLIFNVWTSISKENFIKRNDDLWNNPARVNEEPYFGWLQTSIPTYGNTINLKTVAIENDAGQIPSIKMIEEGPPLTDDQEKGITFDKAMEIVGQILISAHRSNED
jgi:hypothetical protein